MWLWVTVFGCRQNGEQTLQEWQQADTSSIHTVVTMEGALPLVSGKHLKSQLALKEKRLLQLLRIDTSSLSPAGRRKWRQSRQFLETDLATLRQYRDNPSWYNLGGSIVAVLSAADSLPLVKRIDIIELQLKAAPAYFAAAKEALQTSKRRPWLLASQKQLLTLQLLNGALKDSINSISMKPERQKSLTTTLEDAKRSVKDYLTFCNEAYFKENH
jgi:hypothetical protein